MKSFQEFRTMVKESLPKLPLEPQPPTVVLAPPMAGKKKDSVVLEFLPMIIAMDKPIGNRFNYNNGKVYRSIIFKVYYIFQLLAIRTITIFICFSWPECYVEVYASFGRGFKCEPWRRLKPWNNTGVNIGLGNHGWGGGWLLEALLWNMLVPLCHPCTRAAVLVPPHAV